MLNNLITIASPAKVIKTCLMNRALCEICLIYREAGPRVIKASETIRRDISIAISILRTALQAEEKPALPSACVCR